MQVTPESLDFFAARARGRFADETTEIWRALAPRAYPRLVASPPAAVPEEDLRAWAIRVFDGCQVHQVRDRALGVRLTLAAIRAAHLGLGEEYGESLLDFFFRSEYAHESALDWIEHVLDDPRRYAGPAAAV